MQHEQGLRGSFRRQEHLPLTEEERAAVEDGIEAFEKLLKKLEGASTPAEISCSDPVARPQGRSLAVLHQK